MNFIFKNTESIAETLLSLAYINMLNLKINMTLSLLKSLDDWKSWNNLIFFYDFIIKIKVEIVE